MAERFGAIKLNGKSYRIDLNTYRGRDVTDFAPRASTPGGGITFSELNAYQTIWQNDWRHGYGFEWFSDAAGYYETEGSIDPRHEGKTVLFPNRASVITGKFTLFRGISRAWNGTWLAYGAPTDGTEYGMYYSADGVSWSAVAAFLGKTVNHVWSNGQYSFAAVNGSTERLKKSNHATLTTWTDAGNTARCVDYKFIVQHDGYVFLGKASTATISTTYHQQDHQIYFGSKADLSDLEGSEEDDPDYIPVGPSGSPVIRAISHNGEMYFFKYDAIYKMAKDRTSAARILDFSDQYSPTNFSVVVSYNGALYFNIADRLYQWNGVRVQDVSPRKHMEPNYAPNTYVGGTVAGKYMFVVARNSSITDNKNYLYSFDGVGWTRLSSMFVEATDIGSWMVQFVPELNGLYTSTYHPLIRSDLWKYPYKVEGDEVSESLPTTGDNSVIFSKLDAGFRLVYKSTPSIVIQAKQLSATHQYLKVYYRLDTNTDWTPWGGVDGTTNVISTNGLTVLTTPVSNVSALADIPIGRTPPVPTFMDPNQVPLAVTGPTTVEYRWIQFKVTFHTDDSTISPALEGFGVRLIMRPTTGYGYSFSVIAAKDVEYSRGNVDSRRPFDFITDIRACRDSTKWVIFEDPYGNSHYVYVTSVQEIAVEQHVDDMGGTTPNIEQQIMVNLLKVG